MNWTASLIVPVLSLLVIGGMLRLCLRSSPAQAVGAGPWEYHVHGAWFIFAAVGGALVVGLFVLASTFARPEDRNSALGCAAAAAVFFVFFAAFLRSLRVIVDDTCVTARTLFGAQSVPLAELDRVAVIGLTVELRRRPDAAGKRGRPLVFLAAFRGLQDMLATIRSRAALPPEDPVTRP